MVRGVCAAAVASTGICCSCTEGFCAFSLLIVLMSAVHACSGLVKDA